jgi:membrane protease YdiL (CAAX protease family)
MLKKIRSFMDQYAIISAVLVFIVVDLALHGLGQLLSLLPKNLALNYLYESILIIVPIAFVFVFGFSSAFKKGHFGRGLVCSLPYIIWNLILLALLLSKNLKDPTANWQPWYLIVYGLFTVLCVGIREESIYRGIIQNIVAKKYANSVKGIWITAIVGSAIFGVMHISNLFGGVSPSAVFAQVISAMFSGLIFSAIYLRSGNIWSLIFLHTLIDSVGLVPSTFLGMTLTDNLNQMSWSWISLIYWALELGYAAFLLRPSKCKQIYENLCFAGEESKSDIRE